MAFFACGGETVEAGVAASHMKTSVNKVTVANVLKGVCVCVCVSVCRCESVSVGSCMCVCL